MADAGTPITTEAALAKIVAGKGCNEVCRFLRDSFCPMVGWGKRDIMRLVVARQLGF